MKAMQAHRVRLLCRLAVEILDGAQMLADGSPLVFADGSGEPLYDRQLRRLVVNGLCSDLSEPMKSFSLRSTSSLPSDPDMSASS